LISKQRKTECNDAIEAWKKKRLLKTCPLRTQSRNCRTLHATWQRYSLQAIEDNGGLSTLRGHCRGSIWAPLPRVYKQQYRDPANRSSNQPPQPPFTHFLLLKATTPKKKRTFVHFCLHYALIKKIVYLLFDLFLLKIFIFYRYINLCSFLILIYNIFIFLLEIVI